MLTPEEWFITQLLFLGSIDERDKQLDATSLYRVGGIATRSLRENLVSLQEKGILTKDYKIPAAGKVFDPEAVIFNKNFLHSHLKYSMELGQDLLDHYPEYINNLCMTNTTKSFPAEGNEGLFRAYGKRIGWNPKKHEYVLDILERALEANLIYYGICEFVLGNKWERLEKELDGGNKGNWDIMEFVDEYDN